MQESAVTCCTAAYHGQQLCQIIVLYHTLHVDATIWDVCCVFMAVETTAYAALHNRWMHGWTIQVCIHAQHHSTRPSCTFLALLTSAWPTFEPVALALPLCFPIVQKVRRQAVYVDTLLTGAALLSRVSG